MKKNDKIQDSPEFKYLEANFSDFVKEMEEDKESADLKLPDGWEQDFTRIIDETLDGNERKRRRKIIKRIAGVAAAAVLVLVLGNFTAESVSGEGLLEMFRNQFFVGDKQHETYGTNNEIEFDEDGNQDVLYFDGETLEEVSEQIRNELKSPMFYLTYLPEGFTLEEATYDKRFRTVHIELLKETEYIYIAYQKQVDDVAFGSVVEKNENISITNDNIDKEIMIFSGYQDNSWTINAEKGNDLIIINTSVSKEECLKIAENIDYF